MKRFSKPYLFGRLWSATLLLFSLMQACFWLTMCTSEDDMPKGPDNTPRALQSILVYLVADNNLTGMAEENFQQIKQAYYSSADRHSANLFVYMDNETGSPTLYYFNPGSSSVKIKEYNEQNSVEPSVLRQVCTDAFGLGERTEPVNTLLLWSHGTSWFPAPEEAKCRSFGDDYGKQMDIPELADALQGLELDNLLFDACYMGSVEVAAEMVGVADRLVASPAEILSTGFPYQTIIRELCKKEPDMHRLVDLYHDYYQGQDNLYQSGTLTSLNLDRMKDLAMAYGELVSKSYGSDYIERKGLLCYDREDHHLFFDICKVAAKCRDKLAANGDSALADILYTQFTRAWQACEVYTRHTDYMLGIDIRQASGLSVYVPDGFNQTVDGYYRSSLQWSDWCRQWNPNGNIILK